jgi:hypothetical protein
MVTAEAVPVVIIESVVVIPEVKLYKVDVNAEQETNCKS